ncbi:MAG: hypothetical protein RLZZ314_769 [Bacteroidota bacterium]|jgi:rfaE bifunctional protein kinase chain/domain
MIDAYMWGKVRRISPEAPVPVVEITRREQRVGGAANVVKNLHALGAQVDVISVVGTDNEGALLEQLLATMSTPHLERDASRPTTVKTRVISGGQHVVRVDEEATHALSADIQRKVLESLGNLIGSDKRPDVVILEDYDKGFFSEPLIEGILRACEACDIPVAVDPKLRHFNHYRGVALFKPNLKELNEGLSLPNPVHPHSREAMECAVETLMDRLTCERLMVTLGEHGTWIHAPAEGVNHEHIPAIPREVMDVSGAGDTVIAVAALMLASQTSPLAMASLANLAGGWVCERVGVVPISKADLAREVQRVPLSHSPTP